MNPSGDRPRLGLLEPAPIQVYLNVRGHTLGRCRISELARDRSGSPTLWNDQSIGLNPISLLRDPARRWK